MAKRILVPLDEAVQSGSMIEAIGTLARSAGTTVRLLDVARHETGGYAVRDPRKD